MPRIGIAYSLKPVDLDAEVDGPDDRFEEFDRPETVDALAAAIRHDGHEVILLGDGRSFLEKTLAARLDFIFNFAEGEGIGRSRESRVPAVCEMLAIPYSGSDPLTLGLALDKGLARTIVASRGVRVPEGVVIELGSTGEEFSGIFHRFRELGRLPLIVKPMFEGSSKGIYEKCLIDSSGQFHTEVGSLLFNYQQPVLVEEFIVGDEITVGILGNGEEARSLGVMRVVPRVADPRFIYSLEVKRDWEQRVDYEVPANLPALQTVAIETEALKAYHALGCRDVARIDFRLRDGIPYFIEANPLPGLAPVTSDLVILAQGVGIEHGDLVRMILHAAFDRHGLGRKS